MKQYAVRLTGKGNHGRYGKTTYCTFDVSANTRKEAEEKAKDIMFSKTYGELFPKLNDPEVQKYISCYKYSFPIKTQEVIGVNQYGVNMHHYFSEEEMLAQIDTRITDEIFERAQFITNLKK